MSRLRENNIYGVNTSVTPTLPNNPITLSSPTTNQCSWLSAPSFPRSISLPDFLPITVEPGTVDEEIIWLIGWTLGGTTGLVMRNAEVSDFGSGAITHTSVAWQHGPTNLDFHIARSAAVLAKMAFR